MPDLDKDLDDHDWAMIGADRESAGAGAGIRKPRCGGCRSVGVAARGRQDARRAAAALRARARFLSEALRPAESTNFWPRKRDDLGDAAIGEGLCGGSR